jgi:tetratricopeptide (TPR) repeat protein
MTTLGASPVSMTVLSQCVRRPLWHPLLVLPLFISLVLVSAVGQDRSTDEGALRGDRAEIAVTLRNDSGKIITTPATVKIYRSGVLSGQAATTNGRAFFILNQLGDYVITAEAAGYESSQKDVGLTMAIKDEEQIVLHRSAFSADNVSAPGKPLLAPKAEEAFDKGLEALNKNNLDEAQKYLDEAMKLAPSHPDVLYVQGVIYLKRHHWDKAQSVLEKATQLDPKHAHALAALGMALVNAGKFDQAVAPLQRSLELGPEGGWEAHWALAKAYYHRGQYEDAARESQAALTQSHGAAPDIALLVAQSLTAVGRYEDSAQSLRDFLKNYPNDPGAPTARRWLERLAADGKIRGN